MQDKPKTLEEWEEAIGTLAQGVVDLEHVVKAQGELARLMSARIEMLTKLIDIHHEIFVRQGWAPPRAKEGTVAN